MIPPHIKSLQKMEVTSNLNKYSKWTTAGVALTIMGMLSGCGPSAHASNHSSTSKPSIPLSHLKVMGIGGSIALGDDATNGYGYLQRTFHHFNDTYYNKAIYGANSTQLATMYKGRYAGWLSQIHPQVVVIFWGLLNDAVPNTPLSQFNDYLNLEIKQALAIHAMVFVVTPPVTEVSYSLYAKQETKYVQDQIKLVKKMNNPDVYAFDLFSQMKNYLSNHHLNIKEFSGDAHHPNDKGYQLAANLLIADLNHYFK